MALLIWKSSRQDLSVPVDSQHNKFCCFFPRAVQLITPVTPPIAPARQYSSVPVQVCCATNRKVADSIPDGAIGIFHWHNPSGCTMALGSTQPLTEMTTRNIYWGKGGRCVGFRADNLTTILCRCHVIWEPYFLEPCGPLQACNGTALPFTVYVLWAG